MKKQNKPLLKEYRRKLDSKEAKKRTYTIGKDKKKVPYVGTENVDPILDATRDVLVADWEDEKPKTFVDWLNRFNLKKKYKEGEEKEAICDFFDIEPYELSKDNFELKFMEAWFEKMKNDEPPERTAAEVAQKVGKSVSYVNAYLAGIASYIAHELKDGMKDRGSQSQNYGDDDSDVSFSGDEDEAGTMDSFNSGMNRADTSRFWESKVVKTVAKDYLEEGEEPKDPKDPKDSQNTADMTDEETLVNQDSEDKPAGKVHRKEVIKEDTADQTLDEAIRLLKQLVEGLTSCAKSDVEQLKENIKTKSYADDGDAEWVKGAETHTKNLLDLETKLIKALESFSFDKAIIKAFEPITTCLNQIKTELMQSESDDVLFDDVVDIDDYISY